MAVSALVAFSLCSSHSLLFAVIRRIESMSANAGDGSSAICLKCSYGASRRVRSSCAACTSGWSQQRRSSCSSSTLRIASSYLSRCATSTAPSRSMCRASTSSSPTCASRLCQAASSRWRSSRPACRFSWRNSLSRSSSLRSVACTSPWSRLSSSSSRIRAPGSLHLSRMRDRAALRLRSMIMLRSTSAGLAQPYLRTAGCGGS
mmetsp:Transcript_10781/g.35669  ORF Transcript_10781/g.35669 Transcript_10781/m.35669 type:complete len:204 (-) Transcript_10781:233-844(-)